MTQPIEFSNQADAGNGAFAVTQAFQDIKEAAHEHLLTRVEELGAVFAKWSTSRVRQFVHQELEQFVRQQRFPEPAYGSDVITALTMYLAKNANGGTYDGPNMKR